MANVGSTLVDDFARGVISSVGSRAGTVQIIKWTSDRIRQVSNRGQLKSLRVVAQLTLPAAITDGTATVTRGTTIVTGDSDAQTVWATGISSDNSDTVAAYTDQSIVGRWFRGARNWYEITNIEPDGSGGVQLRLANPYTETSLDEASYHIVQRHTKLPADLRSIGSCVHQRLWKPITNVSLDALDFMQPERLYVSNTGPEMFAEVGDTPEGIRVVEFYPYPTDHASVLYSYYKRSPDLRAGLRLPAEFDLEALKQGVLVDVYRYEMAAALRENKVDAAAVWGNHLRSQETVWEKRIEEILRANRATDDLSEMLHTRGPYTQSDLTFIRTARQDALSRMTNFP